MIVHKTSTFPASRKKVFHYIQKLKTLQYVAWPFATFEPVGESNPVWKPGSVSSYRFKLFGLIPFGTHTIRIETFTEDLIQSRERNTLVPTWDHRIDLKVVDGGHTEYTDHIEIKAGWKTVFVWLWAETFYAHRQRKWIRMLEKSK